MQLITLYKYIALRGNVFICYSFQLITKFNTKLERSMKIETNKQTKLVSYFILDEYIYCTVCKFYASLFLGTQET